MHDSTQASDWRYDAFISYRTSHPLDSAVAREVHHALEGYRVPRALVRKGLPRRLRPVFRDQAELAAESNLAKAIEVALEGSRFLIVIGTPETPKSRWIEREVEHFASLGRSDHILVVLAAGAVEDCLPGSLATGPIPLAVCLHAAGMWRRRWRLRREKLRLLARLLGCSYDELWDRERRRRRRNTAIRALAVVVVVAGLLTMVRPARVPMERALARALNEEPRPPHASPRTVRRAGVNLHGVEAMTVRLDRSPPVQRFMAPEMVALPGGRFRMGDPVGDPTLGSLREKYYDEQPHVVELSPFAIGRFEVTVAQYNELLLAKKKKPLLSGPDFPVNGLSWWAAKDYCEWLAAATGKPYRLPTEAEWEYACRGGGGGRYWFGDDASRLSNYAWVFGPGSTESRPVGQKPSNQFGLYDVLGNVEEWVSDWYDRYPAGSVRDPTGGPGPRASTDSWWDEDVPHKISRGGSYTSQPHEARCAARVARVPDEAKVGIRCAMSW
jgi:formylglycine-generating enzyme required for sulfatase activity